MKALGAFLVLIASVMSAYSAVCNRNLKDYPYVVILFYHSLFGIMASLTFLVIAFIFFDRPLYFLDFNPFDNAILFSATALDAFSVTSLTIAYQSGNASFVSLISFVNIIYAMLSDIFIFGEPVSLIQILAAGAILCICVFIGYSKVQVHKVKDTVFEATQIEKH